MNSLRARLLLGTTLGTTAVLLVSGVALYALLSRTLWREFDDSLAARARALTALAEQDGDRLDFELTEFSLPEFEPSDHAEYYQVWLPGGAVLCRSPSLLENELPRLYGAFETPAFRTVTLPDGRAGRIVGMTFTPRQESYGDDTPPLAVTLVFGRGIAGLQTALASVRNTLIGVCLVAVLLSAAVLATVVRGGLKPIENLGGQIARVGENDLSARINAAGVPGEMSPVVDRLNELLARLEAAFERERRFTGDVAHELRTPLAGLRSKLELALSRERSAETYRETMNDCLDINHQMQRMVENLLHLARADAGQLEIRRESVDLSAIVGECWKSLETRTAARGLSVDLQLDEHTTIETDREKLRLVIQNVLDNAVSYSTEHSQVNISTAVENDALTLTVANPTTDQLPTNVARVFDRFWRNDSSQHGGQKTHCGLGLPLCKSVIEQLGGSINALVGANGIFTLTLRIPRGGGHASEP